MSNRPHRRRRQRPSGFFSLPVASKVEFVEHILSHVVPVIQSDRPPVELSPATVALLDRLHAAMVDDHVPERSFDAVKVVF
jgi:hypothetical protein